MTQEQARQEAERRVDEFYIQKISTNKFRREESISCALISINREIELLEEVHKIDVIPYVIHKLNDLNQIKDELLKM
jgi:hypothetical protein